MRGNPEFGHDQRRNLTRLRETYELSLLASSLPKCDVCGKPYVPVPDPVEPPPFLVKPEELGYELEWKSGKIERVHIKCDLETLDVKPDIRERLVSEAKDILRKMGFDPEEVEWLK